MLSRFRAGRGALIAALLGIASLALALSFAACGDDDSGAKSTATTGSNGGASTTQSGVPTDQAYAKTVCTAFNKYLSVAVSQAIQDPSVLNDPSKLQKVGGPALTTFADDMSKVTPPAGLESYHSSVV